MSCKDCGTVSPEPEEVGDEEDGKHLAYWFMVKDGEAAHLMGIEADGEPAFCFAIWPYMEPPETEPGEEILCPECFDKRYPVAEETEDGDTGDNDSWLSYP